MFDVVIVGGGPAGCAAAISARVHGFSVALVERAGHIKRLPGESLHPGVESLFEQLGVLEEVQSCVLRRHTGIWRFDTCGNGKFEPYGSDKNGPWLGFQVNRVELNQIMRQRAIDAGVEWIETSTLRLARYCESGWTLGGPDQVLHAKTLMDATGKRFWLAGQLGLQAERLEETQRIRFGWKTTSTASTDSNPCFTARPDGWEWSAPIGNGSTAWVHLTQGNGAVGTDTTPRIHRKCSGKGWFLLGDAACLTTPAAGNGVLRALMSGMYAVHVHTHVVEGAISQEQGSQAYCSWISAFWESSVKATA